MGDADEECLTDFDRTVNEAEVRRHGTGAHRRRGHAVAHVRWDAGAGKQAGKQCNGHLGAPAQACVIGALAGPGDVQQAATAALAQAALMAPWVTTDEVPSSRQCIRCSRRNDLPGTTRHYRPRVLHACVMMG